MNTPSAEALELAAAIEARWPDFCLAAKPARLTIAELIDAKLQLPERNAALLLAQAVADVGDVVRASSFGKILEAIDELREALKAIKTRRTLARSRRCLPLAAEFHPPEPPRAGD